MSAFSEDNIKTQENKEGTLIERNEHSPGDRHP